MALADRRLGRSGPSSVMARGSDGVMVAAVATPWQTMASAFEFGVTSCEPGWLAENFQVN